MSHAPVTQPVFIPLPPTDPVTMAVLEACNRMPDSHLVKTVPFGELIAFAHALRVAWSANGLSTGPADDLGVREDGNAR